MLLMSGMIAIRLRPLLEERAIFFDTLVYVRPTIWACNHVKHIYEDGEKFEDETILKLRRLRKC